MGDLQPILVVLTVLVGLLSAVIIVLLTALIIVLKKIYTIAASINLVAANLAQATTWLAPAKLLTEITQLFSGVRRHKDKRSRK